MPQMNVATISQPEFINLKPLDTNPLMSECQIKVLYIGENRNRTFISKEVAAEMAKTLRGAPIVGYYNPNKEDFGAHSERITIEDGEIKFETLTKPYGFVPVDAQVWFQTFTDKDDFGNEIEHEYLMTTGYLWTGQYEEAQLPIDEGRPQSMELDGETMKGHWAENSKTGMEFFIINDAIFSKLCILGKDVEPCFEGASISAPEASTHFTLDNNFTKTLYDMMQQLNFALQGGQQMDVKDSVLDENAEKNYANNQDKTDKMTMNENKDPVEEGQGDYTISTTEVTPVPESANTDTITNDYTTLKQEYETMKTEFENLKSQCEELLAYKKEIENQKKDELINSFYMLSEADKNEVIANKDKYTLDEIEANLSIIYTRQQLASSHKESSLGSENNKAPITTYTLEDIVNTTESWVEAVMENENTIE